MATIAQLAQQDLEEKLKLEKPLVRDLKKLFKKLTRGVVRSFGTTGLVISAGESEKELEVILADHYAKVSRVFSSRISSRLPDDVAQTEEERDELLSFLLLALGAMAASQAEIITNTNQRQIDESISQATIEVSEEPGPSDSRSVAVLAGVILARKLSGRINNIACFETQSVAEFVKDSEAKSLVKMPLGIDVPRKAGVIKEWFTRRDDRVRDGDVFNHVRAHNQKRDLNDPFLVSGELLKWPTDRSLGATNKNVAGCRCSSMADINGIISIRGGRLFL